MEHTEEKYTMLEQIQSPAFFVEDGQITAVNLPAHKQGVSLGQPIAPYLQTGLAEYSAFRCGCLYLTLQLGGVSHAASVTDIGSSHLFTLEQTADQEELRSMALAAQILRRPLSNVMIAAQQLFPLTKGCQQQTIDRETGMLNRGLYQMLRVVCNMSDAYNYQTPNPMRTELRDITSLMEEIFSKAQPALEHTGIHLSYSGPQERIFTILEAEKLERAVSNILSNACKFTDYGGHIHASLHRKGNLLCLSVQDNGSGIPPAHRGHVFSRFRRIPGLEDPRFGLGLGMVLIRAAAAAHGGTVLLEDGPECGLRLTMTLAIRQMSDPGVRSPMIHVDYAGEMDHLLLEFSELLPAELYADE